MRLTGWRMNKESEKEKEVVKYTRVSLRLYLNTAEEQSLVRKIPLCRGEMRITLKLRNLRLALTSAGWFRK